MTAPVAGPRRHHLFNRLHDGHAFEGFVEQAELDPAQLEQIGAPTRIRRITFVSVVLMASLVSIDLTIVNVALPAILGDLGGGVEAVQWVASIYSLTFAVCMIPAGRAGDVLGHRRLFLVGGLAYLVASLVAALAPTALVLVVGRAFQGVGAAMVSPAVIALTARVFSPERRHVAFGISAGALSAMAGLGPLVGGALTDALGWRWVFAIGVVFAPVAIVGLLIVPRSIDPPIERRFNPDLAGLAILVLAVGGIQLALIESTRLGWWPLATIALAIGLVAGFFLVRRDRARTDGLIDVRLFDSPVMSGALLAKFLSSFGYFGSLIYVVLFLEGTMGLSAFTVGLVLLLPAIVGVAASPVAGRLLRPATTRPMVVVGMLFQATAVILLGTIESTSHPGLHVVPSLVLCALGFSMISVTTKVAPLDDLPSELYGRASALMGTVGKMAGGFGVAASAALFNAFSSSQARRAIDARQLEPPLTVANVKRCLGVDDVQSCVDGLVRSSSQLRSIRSETVDAITVTFEGTLAWTLSTVGAISIAAIVVVWRLLRPRTDH